MKKELRIKIDWFGINLAVPTDEEATKFINRLDKLCQFYAKAGSAYSFNWKTEE